MKVIFGLSVTIGSFFGLVAFVIITIIDGATLGIPIGLLAGGLFGGFLAVYMIIYSQLQKKKYLKFSTNNIDKPILFEDSFFRLNGNSKDAGHLYLTDDTLIMVMLKGKRVVTEIRIPLTTIAHVEKRNDYGHLANTLIIQQDGSENRFIADHQKLCEKLIPIIGYEFFDSNLGSKTELLDKQHMHLNKYIDQIDRPSKDFQAFLNDYFTGHPMIRGRVEEDQTVWAKLKDQELEIAKQMVLDNLGHDTAYIRAIGIFRDERAIPMLKKLIENLPQKFCYERLLAARVLYDWIGYEDYLKVLAEVLPHGGEYTKTSLDYWTYELDKETAIKYIFMLLQDESSFVRWCAYGAMLKYFNLGEQEYEDTKYYTDDKVYADKALFEGRLKALKEKIEAL